MALDIHAGKSRKSHKWKFSVKEGDYDEFLNEIRKTSMSLNKLNRLGDFYTDAVFRPEELNGLIAELNLLVEHGKGGKSVALALISTAQEALNEGLHIFAFAD